MSGVISDPRLLNIQQPRYGAISGGSAQMNLQPQQQPPGAQVPIPGVTAPALPTPGATGSQFGPNNNLIGTQLNATPSADTSTARGYVGQNLGALQTAPDRGQLAAQTFQQLQAASDPQYQKDLRGVTDLAAATGRLGSGVTTSELGDVASNRQKYLGNLEAQLATQSAGQTMQDRLNQLSAGQNVLGQFSGLDQTAYGNTVGERSYQQGLSQQAFQNNAQQNALLASLGGFNPNAAQDLSQQGAGNIAGGSTLLNLLMQNRRGTAPYQYSTTQEGDNPNPAQRGY